MSKKLFFFFFLFFLSSFSFAQNEKHTFTIGDKDLLLDGKKFQMRCGEIHFARVPKEYWRHRLQLCKAMGLNTVCAYLFWNYHEFEQGKYHWAGQADAAEFCKIAQEEGLWVILRPGPYACAEWDGGGMPWWLLKNPKMQLRTKDADFVKAAATWLKEVGRVLGKNQVTKGGNILMAQVENEYGSYGDDSSYMGSMRQALLDGGFDIPLFACNPRGDLKKGFRNDLFQVVNFGSDPQSGFKALRDVQKKGPLMCGEFYPGWFDTWGAPHHLGKTDQYLADLDFMLKSDGSFSIYMAHGGTSFGLWAGADRPFKPDTSSYDYDAPIGEQGNIGEKFSKTRDLMKKYLLPDEKIPDAPAAIPVMSIPEFSLTEVAGVFENLHEKISDNIPKNMEAYNQGHGCMNYRCTVPAGAAATLSFEQIHDFAWIYLDGKQVGITDRRSHRYQVILPERKTPQQLDIFVETMGHVNFGKEVHDRKGISGKVLLDKNEFKTQWQIFPVKLDEAFLKSLSWKSVDKKVVGPKFFRTKFSLTEMADTYLDMSSWGKGVVWVNGHCLARYWNIGPTQTAYLPGAWLKKGENEIIVFDLLETEKKSIAGVTVPILNQLRPELDFANANQNTGTLEIKNRKANEEGILKNSDEVQTVKFKTPVTGKQFCLEALNAHDGKPYAAIAELDLLDSNGQSLSHATWTIAYVSSQELAGEDGSASNAINGQTSDFWHTEWKNKQTPFPHQLVIDLGTATKIAGFRYTPRAGNNPGKIKEYKIFVGDDLVKKSGK